MTDSTVVKATVNVNVGLLGHVDSGKTTLAKSLSSISSTAAFDKNPQSQVRGITLDLGFSAFYLPPIEGENDTKLAAINRQVTLVDCPGHSSLVRTMIGGANIIDLLILVVDAAKGIQPQTAECLVIGEITTNRLIVALNKIDGLKNIELDVEKIVKKIRRVLEQTKFKDALIIPISAREKIGIDLLISAISESTKNIQREDNYSPNAPFVMAIDHCFAIKGHGTVLTGTVLSGTIGTNDTIEIPKLGIFNKKIKSIQAFKRQVDRIVTGDRAGICVAGLDSSAFERGLICSPKEVALSASSLLCKLQKIKYFKENLESKTKFHITIGHETVMGTVIFFKSNGEYLETWENDCLTVINLEASVILVKEKSVLIGSKLDIEVKENSVCRIAFHSKIIDVYKKNTMPIWKEKSKTAYVDRIVDPYIVIIKDLCKKEAPSELYIGKHVSTEDNILNGMIESSFGKSGKFKVIFKTKHNLKPNDALIYRYRKIISL